MAFGGRLLATIVIAIACAGGAAAKTIVVGGKAFTEQQIMTAMTVALLKAKGFNPERKAGMGSAAISSRTTVPRPASSRRPLALAPFAP